MDSKHKVFNLIILDESGSMQTIKRTIIDGFNEVVQNVKGVARKYPEQEHLITFVTFNGLATKILLENQPVEQLGTIDENSFRPEAMTPLYDAMGQSITRLRKTTDELDNYNVLVTILTDGEENASLEYDGTAIKDLVDELKLKRWTFTYIGANHDVEAFATKISITNVLKFDTTQSSMKEMFGKEMASRVKYSQKIREKKDTTEGYYRENDQ